MITGVFEGVTGKVPSTLLDAYGKVMWKGTMIDGEVKLSDHLPKGVYFLMWNNKALE